MGDKIENNKFVEVLSDNDLERIASHFLNNYRTCPQTHVDAIYFFLTYLNGDRAAEKALKTKVKDIQLADLSINSGQESTTIRYIRRSLLNSKTGLRDAYAVVPFADETDLIQPYTVIRASNNGVCRIYS